MESPEISCQNFVSFTSQIPSLDIELWKVGRGLERMRVREGEKHAGVVALFNSTACSQWSFRQVAELVDCVSVCACVDACVYKLEL